MPSHIFGHLDGAPVHAFALGSSDGLSATITQYGGRLVSLEVPLTNPAGGGGKRNVVLGFDRLEPYLTDGAHLGAITGRYANRIAGGRFDLDGQTYQLPRNNGANTLHGGPVGFGARLWSAEPDDGALVLRLHSADGDQGFPGALEAQVRYAVTDDALEIDYTATCDSATVVNLTNHAYFNLAGAGAVLDHVLHIAADRITPVDAALIPTGGFYPVSGTPLDFRTPATVGARIAAPDPQMALAGGYDHNFVLAEQARDTEQLAASLECDGIRMLVTTTEPGIQFYSGNFLNGSPFAYRSGLCLETQHFPDSPNQPSFPSTVLRPGAAFRSRTAFRFPVG